MKLKDVGEFGIIDLIKNDTIINPERIIQGIGDDTAVEKISQDRYLLSTCDMLVEGIHFIKNLIAPWQLGYKAGAVNLSDIAAMGGKPTGILVSLGLPKDIEVEYITEFYRGLKLLCNDYKTNILGGDIVSNPKNIVISVTALGEVSSEQLTLRSGAEIGNAILVTGTLGDSGAGLEILLHQRHLAEKFKGLLKRHLTPVPQIKEADFLTTCGKITSMNDISDGLANEINEISQSSGVGAEIFADRIPLSDGVQKLAEITGKDPLEWALYGGEDFQLVFTCSHEEVNKLQNLFREKFQRNLYYIGNIISPQKGVLINYQGDKKPLISKGYNHFASI